MPPFRPASSDAMDYYELLNLKKEPFSNSPDPNYMFQSRQHRLCLQRLELSVRLKRGLNVVVGEVGTGKTTLCRQLLVRFGKDPAFESYLILEPQVCTPYEFLQAIATHFDAAGARAAGSDAELKEIIKNHLYRSGVEQGRTIVLIIDEGQKMPPFSLEVVRELLNYETNEHKLLQIVIFAQPEFDTILQGHTNVADRISMRHDLRPMGFRDTQLMIAYRLHQAGLTHRSASPFSSMAIVAIYLASGGYPRKIVNLCHQCVLALLIQNRRRAGWRLVRSCVSRMRMDPDNRLGKASWSFAIALGAVVVAGVLWMPQALTGPEPITPGVTIAENHSPPPSPPMTDRASHADAADIGSPAGPVAAIADQRSEDAAAKETPPPVVPSQSPPPAAAVDAPASLAAAPPPAAPASSAQPPRLEGADAEKSPPAPEAGAMGTTPPGELGAVVLRRYELLSWIMIKVYGGYDQALLGPLLAKNPGIDDPNSMEAGQRIVLPAAPVRIRWRTSDNWWVSLMETDRVEDALDAVRRYPSDMPPVRIIPYWDTQAGMRFRLILWAYFSSESDADQVAATLSRQNGTSPAVFADWPKTALFYADPFSGTRQ